MGQDCKTWSTKGCLGAKIFGARAESVRFRIRTSKNTITTAKAKTTRPAITKASRDAEMLQNSCAFEVTQYTKR